ncbi:unnamed protein product [Heterobilharzia americana]|nr:unnamed protein product [Heterobilharzia americana]
MTLVSLMGLLQGMYPVSSILVYAFLPSSLHILLISKQILSLNFSVRKLRQSGMSQSLPSRFNNSCVLHILTDHPPSFSVTWTV